MSEKPSEDITRDLTQRIEAEAGYRTLVEQLPAIIYIAKPRSGESAAYDVSYMSPRIEEVLGYPAQRFVEDQGLWDELIHPDDLARAIAEDERAGETGELFSIEYRMFDKDEQVVWFRDEAELIRNPEGEPLYWQGVMTDVTRRKEADESLKEAEERYRALVENVPAVIYIDDVDEANSVIYRSPFVREVLGYESEEFYSDPYFWQNILHSEDRERVLAENERTNETGEPFRIEYRMIRKDGRAVWIRDEAVLIRDEEGNPKFWQGYFTDITGRKEAEERYRAVMERTEDGIFFGDFETLRVLEANAALGRMLGYTVEELRGMPLHDFITGDREAIDRNNRLIRERGSHFIGERRYRRKDGALIDVETSATTIPYGSKDSSCCIARDITERKRVQRALEESERRFRQLFEQSVDAMYVHDEEGRFVDCNAQACTLLGYTREELLSMTVADISRNVLIEEERARQQEREGGTLWQRALAGEPGLFSHGHEEENIRKDGTTFPVEVRVGSVDYAGRRMMCVSVRDITERKEAEEALGQSEQRFRGAFENASTGVALVSLDNHYLRVNRALCEMLGYSEEELLSKKSFDITHPEDQVKSRGRPKRMLEEGGPDTMSIEKRYLRKDGGVVWAVSEVSLIRDSEGNPSHFVSHFQDITERKNLEEQPSYQVLHDPLTGLPNRSSLQRRFERVAGHVAGRPDDQSGGLPGSVRYVAVLFLDLDGFKEVNDSLGHAAGDELLRAVAGRLQNVVKPQDTVARLGGDEFCVLLAGVSGTAEAVRVAWRLKTSIETPFSIVPSIDPDSDPAPGPTGTSMVSLSTSIGIAVSEPGGMEQTLDELLREADAAMYRAKKRGGALYEVVELTESAG